MPIIEQLKKFAGKLTGIGRPRKGALPRLIRKRPAVQYHFADDGETPNHPRWPLLVYRDALALGRSFDAAAVCEEVFAAHGWTKSWRDGVYDHNHFHTGTHEALAIARGRVNVQFGGVKGKTLALRAGDVVVLPAGTGHRRTSGSRNLLVVGAYPAGGRYDEPKPGEADPQKARRRITRTRKPLTDPVFGAAGTLHDAWETARVTKSPSKAAASQAMASKNASSKVTAGKTRKSSAA